MTLPTMIAIKSKIRNNHTHMLDVDLKDSTISSRVTVPSLSSESGEVSNFDQSTLIEVT